MDQSIYKMIVYYEVIYGIVDAEELFYLLNMTPKEFNRLKIKQFRREIDKDGSFRFVKAKRMSIP